MLGMCVYVCGGWKGDEDVILFFPKKELCLPSGFLDSWIQGHREMKTFS